MTKKLNWNAKDLALSTQKVDKEMNKGLILSTGHILQEKRVSQPLGYRRYIQENGLKDCSQEQLLKTFIDKGLFDFYLYNILSTDKFYTKKADGQEVALFSRKNTLEFTIVIYMVNERRFLKGYFSIYDADKVQIGTTQTVFIQEIAGDRPFIMVTDIQTGNLKGDLQKAFEVCINNFADLKTLTTAERQEKLQKALEDVQKVSDGCEHYVSLQTQSIAEIKKDFDASKLAETTKPATKEAENQ